MGRFPRTTGR